MRKEKKELEQLDRRRLLKGAGLAIGAAGAALAAKADATERRARAETSRNTPAIAKPRTSAPTTSSRASDRHPCSAARRDAPGRADPTSGGKHAQEKIQRHRKGHPSDASAGAGRRRPARPPHIPGAVRSAHRRRGLGQRVAVGAVKQGRCRRGGPLTAGATRVKSVCTHCSVGCTVIAEVKNGVWVGQEPGWDSPFNHGFALRQGRLGARARPQRTPAEISAEARERPMDPRVVGPGDQRNRRQDAGDPQGIGSGFGLLARLRQVQQRAGLSVPQVLRVLGLQQRRPPGAHLPFHHGRGRREYVGLWRDDQFLQRHAQFQG